MSLFGGLSGALGNPFGGGLGNLLFGQSGAGPSLALFNKLSMQQQQMLNKAVGFQQLGINGLQGGFDQARTATTQASGVAKQQSRDIATSALGAAQNSAVSRGLGNTSTFDAVNRGIGSDLMRHLAGIDAMTSQQLGGLDIQQAGAKAAAYGQMGNLYSQFGQSQNALGSQLMGIVGQNRPGILGPLLSMAGMAMGAGGGGGGGYGGGGYGGGSVLY